MYPIVKQFTDTATTNDKTYNYDSIQNCLSITNKGNTDLIFEVGKYGRVVLHPMQTWSNDVDFTSFKIKAFKSDCSFEAVVKDCGSVPATVSQLTDMTKNMIVQNLYLKSPNGTTYQVLVSDSGVISSTLYSGSTSTFAVVGSAIVGTSQIA